MKILVGAATCGISAGAEEIYSIFKKELDGTGIEVIKTGCIGFCYLEVLVEIEENGVSRLYKQVTPEMAHRICEEDIRSGKPICSQLLPKEILDGQTRIVLKNCGKIEPTSVEEYISVGGYSAIKKILDEELTPEAIIAELRISGLRGRGGGGFPTASKWNFARNSQNSPKYIICNADEGDPGAFMDRSVLEGDPHAVLEGMLIAAKAIGAEHGYIYVRSEYPLANERVSAAIQNCREHHLLGESILGSDFSFDIDIREGAGAFVCGEETALIASMGGYRGMPNARPPYPAIRGFRNSPTLINNVETLAAVPAIIRDGGLAFSKLGTERSKGTKVFSLTGKVKNPSLIEVEMGTSIDTVVNKIGGGIIDDKKFKAVQMGGPSGGSIPSELSNLKIDYETINSTGAIMGSGGMIVLDETTCMVELARFFLSFTQDESCGKCTFCRIGTKRMLEILTALTEGRGEEHDIDELEKLALSIKKSSLCGLGQSAPNPVLTGIKYFRDEFLAHARDKKCPAKSCKQLLSYEISPSNCKRCGLCYRACPVHAISREDGYKIDNVRCIKCGKCFSSCRFNAVEKS